MAYYGPPRESHIGAILATVFIGLWLAVVAFFTQTVAWVIAQLMLASGLDIPALIWPITGLIGLVLAGAPALMLALIPKYQPARQAGRVWTVGSVVLGLGSALRVIPLTENEWYLLAFAVLVAIGAFFLRKEHTTVNLWGVVGGLLVLAPFLWAGALGGVVETVCVVLAAVALGWLASVVLNSRFWDAYDNSPARRIMLGGLIAGVFFALLAAGSGGSGIQLLLLLVLPPLGFAAAALRRSWALVSIAAFGPLAFAEPKEVNLFLLDYDVPMWVGLAALASWLVAVVIGLVYGLASRHLSGKRVAAVTAGVATLAAGGLYVAGGQPGFHGDQLFVVMKDQAVLSGIPTTTGPGPGRDARVRAVYQQLVEHADRTQANLRSELDSWHLSYQPYYLVNAIRVTGGPEVRAWLELRDDVDRVLRDQKLRPVPVERPEARGTLEAPTTAQWNLKMLNVPVVWPQTTGKGIVVGSSDSGVDGSHPALKQNYRGGDDSWYDPWDGSSTPNDQNGHGTHTTATAVGREHVGVAWEAQWIACVNLDRNMASPSLYLDCMQFMLAPFPRGGTAMRDGNPERAPHVLTNSWGCPNLEGCDDTVLRPATAAIAAAGIAFVAAAGNSGPRCGSIDEPPATDPSAITVAAVDKERALADFSSRGLPGSGKPDITAPGVNVLSAMPGGTYAENSGTSMATPHVAGAIALLWAARPELIGDLTRTRELLASSADPQVSGVDACGQRPSIGAGILNMEKALNLASQ